MRRCLLALLVLVPAVATAQSEPRPPAVPYTQTFAINPLALPFGLLSAEYERAVGAGFTVGVGGSYFDGAALDNDEYDGDDDARSAWFEGKLLYYPNEIAFRGFSAGLTLGYVNERRTAYDRVVYAPNGVPVTAPEGSVSEGAATLGVLLDYNWLLGRRKRFVVGTGIGARRVLKDVEPGSPLSQVYPDGRLVLGIAF